MVELTSDLQELLVDVLTGQSEDCLDPIQLQYAREHDLVRDWKTLDPGTGQKWLSLTDAGVTLLKPVWSNLPYCLVCDCHSAADHDDEGCSAEPTYDGAAENRCYPCTCELPCPAFVCERCEQPAPWCHGASDHDLEGEDTGGLCDACWVAVDAEKRTRSGVQP